MSLSEEQIRRYSRQILLPEVGGKGQRRLLASELQVHGLGAVGVYCSLYLAAAGVGRLWLLDDTLVSVDDVGLAGIYQPADVNLFREEVVQRGLSMINPEVLCLIGAAPSSARTIVCGSSTTKLEHQSGLRAGVLRHQAIIQSGCLTCAEVLSDGEDILDEAHALIAGSIAAYEALRTLLDGSSPVANSRLSFGDASYQRQTIICSQTKDS